MSEEPTPVEEQPVAEQAVAETNPNPVLGEGRTREALPPPEFEPPSDEDTGLHDAMVKRLYEDMGVVVEEEEKAAEPVPEQEAEPQAEQEAEPQAEQAEETPPLEDKRARTRFQGKDEIARELVDSIRDVVRAEVPRPEESLPVPPSEKSQGESSLVDETEGLLEEQKFELELMEMAEKKMPEKYKGIRSKSLKFYKDMDEWIEKRMSEDDGFNQDDNAEEIEQYLLKNKPSLDRIDERKIERELIREQALDEFNKNSQSKFNELEQKTRMIEERPKIQADSESFKSQLLEIEGIDALAMLRDGKASEASAQYPMESSVANDVTAKASKIYEDFCYYNRGLATFEEKRESMEFLDGFLAEQGNFFAQQGGEARVRDGKQFLPVSEYNNQVRNNPDTKNRYWTFDHIDVRNLLAEASKEQIKASISAMEEQISKYGFVRKPADSEPARKESPEAQAINPPKASVSPAPGSADPRENVDPSHPAMSVIDTLGLRGEFPQVVE